MSEEPIQIERMVTIEDRSEEIHRYVYKLTKDTFLNALKKQGITSYKTIGESLDIDQLNGFSTTQLVLGKWKGQVPDDEFMPQQAYYMRRYESTPEQHAKDTMAHFLHALADYVRGFPFEQEYGCSIEVIPPTYRPWDRGLEAATKLLRSEMEACITKGLHNAYGELLAAMNSIYHYSYMDFEYIAGNEDMFDGVFERHNDALTELGWDAETIKKFRQSLGWHKYVDRKNNGGTSHDLLYDLTNTDFSSIDLDDIVGEMEFEREIDYDGQQLRMENWWEKVLLDYEKKYASAEEEEL